MAENFYTILTRVGLTKVANSQVTGNKVNLTTMAVGDGAGAYYNPTIEATSLRREVWRGSIGVINNDENNPNWIVIETVIPAVDGGFFVREVGLFDDEGDLIAIGKYPETYKPVLADGSAKDLYIRMIIEVSNASAVTLKIDPAVVLASRKYVDDQIKFAVTPLKQSIEELQAKVYKLPAVSSVLNRGINTITVDQDTPVNVISFEGKTVVNHVPLFDSGLWEISAEGEVVAPNKLTIESTERQTCKSPVIFVKTDTDYTLSLKHTGIVSVVSKDGSKTLIQGTNAKTVTFNSGMVSEIQLQLETTGTGTFTFEDVSIVEGTSAKEFVANVQGITNPTIENKTTGESLTLLGTFHEGDVVNVNGTVRRTKREVVLDGSFSYAYNYRNTGHKSIKVNFVGRGLGNFTSQSNPDYFAQMSKYNGLMLGRYHTQSTDAKPDTMSSNGNELFINISNIDSGWGDNYTPTVDEIKAYFLGWKMFATDRNTLYEGTGKKYWYPISRLHDTFDIAYRVDTNAPKIEADNKGLWQPYRLIFELATPATEQVQAIGSLTLAEGENQLAVTEGRIVREKANPLTTPTANHYHIAYGPNDPLSGSKFHYKPLKIRKIYKNGSDDTFNWTIYNKNADPTHNPDYFQGIERAFIPKANFDPAATYEVEYTPLEPYKVTAHTNPIEINYQLNQGSAISELVKQASDIDQRMNNEEHLMRNIVLPAIGSGTIVESGTNANGTFMKLANGIMICISSASGDLEANVEKEILVTYPALFVDYPSNFLSLYSISKTSNFETLIQIITHVEFSSSAQIVAKYTVAQNYRYRILSIGRWK